jgi:hypothetical protein
MIRRAAVIIFALVINPALLRAQDLVLTVSVPSADVYKGPSTATPVIGRVPRGSVLPVSRNLGSWIQVPWPDAQDRIGYVHVTMGHVGPPSARPITNSSPQPSSVRPSFAQPSSPVVPATTTIPPTPPLPYTPPGEQARPISQLGVMPPSHVVGFGGLVGSPNGFGATARVWRNKHLGIQFGFTRDAMTSDVAAGRVTSMQFEPGVVYALFDRISDYLWFRPYVGSVMTFRHQTLSIAPPVALEPAADNSVGFRVFGGSELTLPSLPRFGVSVDVGYRKFPTVFPGFEADSLSVSIAGHWYIK